MKNSASKNLALFAKTFRDSRWTILLYCIILISYVAMMIAFFPSIRDQGDEFKQLLEIYPKAMIEGFGIDVTMFTTIEGFLAIEYFKITWVIVIAILTFSLGASVISKEIDKGTSEYTFTLPLLRQRIVLSKFIGFYIITLFIVFVSIYSAIIGIYLIDEDVNLEGWSLFFVLAAAFSFALLAFSTFLSTLFSSKGKVYAVCTGFLIFSYMLDFLAGIDDRVADFHFLSFFKYLGNIGETLREATIEPSHILLFVIVGLVFLVGSLIVAEKRDL